MSEYLKFSLDVPIGTLAKEIKAAIPQSIVEKFKEGLSSSKGINPIYFEEGKIELHAEDPIQAYNMGCYARIYIGNDSQMLVELLF
jgi:hypothetical protein